MVTKLIILLWAPVDSPPANNPLVAFDNNLNRTVKYDEQTYNESKFLYKKDTLGGLFNSSIFLLKHVDYSIEEINE